MAHIKNHLLLGNIIVMLTLALAFTARSGQAAPVDRPALIPPTTSFYYEGQASPMLNGVYDLRLRLYDAPTGGNLVGNPNTVFVENVPITNGVYTVKLDFGPAAVSGVARWLQVDYRPFTETGGYTFATTRPQLLAVPYAQSLFPGATISGNVPAPGRAIIRAGNTGSGVGLWGSATSNAGVYGEATTGRGVWGATTSGDAGVYGETGRTDGSGVYGKANAAGAAGVYGRNEKGRGVWGYTPTGTDGVYGQSDRADGSGVQGLANGAGAAGVFGVSSTGTGVWGRSGAGVAMRAEGNAVQSRDKGGWVKAQLLMAGDGELRLCYNGVTGSKTGACGFTLAKVGAQDYTTNFGFASFDRFVATSGASTIHIVQWNDNNTMQFRVGNPDHNYAYFITIY